MANIHGESGVWKKMLVRVRASGYEVGAPGDIEHLVRRERETQHERVQAHTAETDQKVDARKKRITELKSRTGFLGRVTGTIGAGVSQVQILKLRIDDYQYQSRLESNIRSLESIPRTDIVGAEGELAVAQELQRLPVGFTVLNDVRLRTDTWLRFKGASVRSAQADHIVLSHAGVFVVETKNWSRQFIHTRAHMDPFLQVDRAGFICKTIIHDQLNVNVVVRRIIACVNHVPEVSDDSWAKAVLVQKLSDYIVRFNEKTLSDWQLHDLHRLLARYQSE